MALWLGLVKDFSPISSKDWVGCTTEFALPCVYDCTILYCIHVHSTITIRLGVFRNCVHV